MCPPVRKRTLKELPNSQGHVRAVLLKSVLALRAVAVGVNQAAYCSNIAWLKLGDCGADLGDTTDYLVSWNAWIDSGHRAPLVTDLVEVRMADTAEKDFDLNVTFARITPRDRRGCKWRFRTRSRVSLRFILTT
jgi:hypothetical protein